MSVILISAIVRTWNEKHIVTFFHMKNIIEKPLLPDCKVGTILTGDCQKFNNRVEGLGIECIVIPSDRRLPLPVRGHADLQCCQLEKGNIFTSSKGLVISEYSVNTISETPGKAYPLDCLLNCFIIDNTLICGKDISADVLNEAEKENLNIKTVKQGYAKCSCALVDEHAVITSDRSIANALYDIADVLVIDAGQIDLPGYNYGFIGGCAGKIDRDKLVFCGNPLLHSSGKNMIRFLEEHDCDAISLSNDILFDFGGFIPLYYK